MKRYAIFDLDYTLIPHDTILLFANFILKKQRWRIYYLIFLIFLFPLIVLKLISSKTLKQIFLSFLWNMDVKQIEQFSNDFVQSVVLDFLYDDLRKEINQLKSEKYILILNTAAPEFYAKHIGNALGFHYVIATPFRNYKKFPLFPEIVGENNKSYIKIQRLIPFLPESTQKMLKSYTPQNSKSPEYPIQLFDSISYSDSIADLPLLRLTEKAKLVNPENHALIQEAKKKNWEILTPSKPYHNRIQKYWIAFRQCLGIYL